MFTEPVAVCKVKFPAVVVSKVPSETLLWALATVAKAMMLSINKVVFFIFFVFKMLVENWLFWYKLTKGIAFIDWKTKWHDYDLRISIHAPKHLQDLANDIEYGFYNRGRQEELVEQIKAIDPNASIILGSIDRLQKQLDKLENEQA